MLRATSVLLLIGCWQLISPQPALIPAGLLAVAAVGLAGVALALIAQGGRLAIEATARPLSSRAAALRRKSWTAVCLRLVDPDASGRPRPRAPSADPAAA